MAAKEREEIKATTRQKMARRHKKEGGNHLEQESNGQKTTEDIDGGPHPEVKRHNKEGGNHLEQESNREQWNALMEGYILQWIDKA